MVREQSAAELWSDLPIPIFVVEIASKSTRLRDVGAKRQYYLDLSVPDYWFVDKESRRICVIRPGRAVVVAGGVGEGHPNGAHEPLVVDVAAYFREALGEER